MTATISHSSLGGGHEAVRRFRSSAAAALAGGLFALAATVPLAPASGATPEERDIKIQRMRPENATCLIERRGKYVEAWLSTLPGTAAERRAIRPVEQDFTACFTYFPNAYRSVWDYSGIRRGLIRERLRTVLPRQTREPPAALANARWFSPEQASDPGSGASLLANDLGFCVARSEWPATLSLVRAQEGSADEKAALRAIVAHVPGCVPPGQKLTLDTARLRTILEETVFHATAGY